MVSLSVSTIGAVVLALVARDATAHIVLWHDSMFGWDQSNINQNDAVTPLADMTFGEWWFHGYKDKKPAEGKFMDLPAGGTFHGEVACNKAQTSWNPEVTDDSQLDEFACHDAGPMHTTDTKGSENPTNVKGCGLAIAYTSDENNVKPEDFTVFSVDHNCPWKRKVDFPVPADLPACPEGGCLCSWGWIHSPESGSEQMYHSVYRCKVSGATETRSLPAPLTANKCDYPSNTANCTVGGKQPHYWLQKEGNNNFQDYYDPPYYNAEYGFMQGAQTDLFAGVEASRPTLAAESSPVAPTSTVEPVEIASAVEPETTSMAQSEITQEVSTSATSSSVEPTAASSSVVPTSIVPVSTAVSSATVSSQSGMAPMAPMASMTMAAMASMAPMAPMAPMASMTMASMASMASMAPMASASSSVGPTAPTQPAGKACKRSMTNVVRRARRHTRAARVAAAAETVRLREILQDRQRLQAEGMAILARSKLV